MFPSKWRGQLWSVVQNEIIIYKKIIQTANYVTKNNKLKQCLVMHTITNERLELK